MMNDLKYTVRSREIVDLIAAMRNSSITLSPYFQRNLVWRDAHKKDFIDTILQGYPFPQIFLARGPIDLDSMTASQAVVDGQQRLSTIRDYVHGNLEVHGKLFGELSTKERENFLKYEVAVIDFDLDAGDDRLKDIFRRLNRTYYSLSAIEKLASEYSASDFMLVARLLSGEIRGKFADIDDYEPAGAESAPGDADSLDNNAFSRDPGIDEASWIWLLERADGPFAKLIRSGRAFSSFEFDRKIPLMFTLNIMCTYLVGYYERNDRVRKMLDERSIQFPEKQDVIDTLNSTADFVERMELEPGSLWWNKANFFTMLVELSRVPELRSQHPLGAADKLRRFGASLPPDYALAAKEAVSRKPQRELRGKAVRSALQGD